MDASTTNMNSGVWSADEHERFLQGLQLYPFGPWKAVADFVTTRTVRQVQTHAQKYHEKAARRLRDLRQTQHQHVGQPDPKVDKEMKEICETLQQHRVPLSPRSAELQQQCMDHLAQTQWASRFAGSTAPSVTTTAASTAGYDGHTPSFDECLDFLIEALASCDEEAP